MNLKLLACLCGFLAVAFLAPQISLAHGTGKKKKAKKAKVVKDGEKKDTATTAKKEKGKKKKKKTVKAEEAKKENAEASEASKDPKKQAKAAYKKGKEFYDKGDYQAALESFMTAYNAMPNPFVYISIAQCYDKLDKCQEARDYYLKYTQEKPGAGNIPDVKDKITELEARKGKVSILSDPEGASITLDGETTDMVTPAEVELQGGDHALALNKDGYIMETRAFTVPICGEVEISVALGGAGAVDMTDEGEIDEAIDAVSGKKKKARRKIKLGIPHYVAFSLAGAAAITAAVTGGLALNKSNDFKDKKDDYEANPTDDRYSELEDIKSSGRPLAIVSDVSIGVAAVAAVTGIALLFIGPKESKEVSVSPIITPAGGGASVSVNF